jgi:PPE-repeat protein
MEYAGMPPEVASGLVYTGPQSAPLAEAAAAWQALAADLGATATAMQTAVANLVGASWTGPTSVTMGGAGEQHVQWLVQAAAQAEETAGLAAQAAAIVDAVYTGVAPPPLIAANRAALVTLIGTNFMGCNSGAIAANQAQYQGMWAQDSTALYSYAGDSAGVVGGLIPFVPLAPTVNPAGAADQAVSVSQAAAQSAGNAAQKATSATNQLSSNTSSTAGGASDIMSMAPQFLSSVPQVLQGMAQPLMSANPMSSLGSFQSLLSPFMSGLGGSGMGGAPALAAATSPLSSAIGGAGGGLGGIGGGTGALSAAMGGAPKLGGLSVPATWAASAQSAGGANNATSATSGINANSSAAPGGTSGGMGGGGAAPMAAMNGRGQSGGNGPSYGSPIRVLPRPR